VTPVLSVPGPEILPGTREYAWVASVVAAVERRTGRPSRWDRRLFEETSGVFAAATPNGPMTVSREHVLDPVLRGYDAPEELSYHDHQLIRLATAVVIHETDHHQAELGDPAAPDAIRELGPADMALSEGFAELKAKRLTTAVMEDTGMDRAIPGSTQARIGSVYPGYRGSVEGVVLGLQELTGRPRHEIVSAIQDAPRLQRYNAMADLLIDARLDGLMPPEHRSQVRLALTRPLLDELAAMTEHESPTGDQRALDSLGHEHAERALGTVEQQLAGIEQHYRAHGDHPPRMPMSAQERAQVQRIEAYYGRPSIDLETTHLRQFLDSGAHSGLAGGGTAAGGGAAGAAASGAAAAARSAWRPPPSNGGQAR